MPELSVLRAQLKDRQTKAGALGTTETTVCLDLSLLADLEQLQHELAVVMASKSAPGSLAGTPPVSTTEIDALIDAKRDEIKAASLIVVFRALASTKYQEIVNQFEDPDDEDQNQFLDALSIACWHETWSDGEKVELPWSEIKEGTQFGELAEVREKVFNLNRRKQDIPLSSRPSKNQRPSAAKLKPVSA